MGLQTEMLVNASGTLPDDQLVAVELFKGYPDGLMKFATACCVIFMLIGIPGNIITIVALARYKNVRNATATFIMNLSCSDLLSCCFNMPLAVSTFLRRSWIHGQFLCRIFPFIRYALVSNSLFTVLVITINRYIMIAHPKSYTKLYKKRNIIIMLLCSWIIPFGTMIPILFEIYGRFGLDVNNGSCSMLKDYKNRSPKKVLVLMAFILPSVVIIICYGRIFCIVRKATKKLLKAGRRVPNSEDSSSANLPTSYSVCVTGEISCNYSAGPLTTTKTSSKNTNTANQSTATEISYKIIRQSDEFSKTKSRLNRKGLNKSIKFMKMALPTRKDRRLGTMIIAILISFWLCNLPITITDVLLEINPNPILNIVAHLLFYLSSCINPIIYVIMSNEYRKAYRSLFKCQNT